MGDFMAKQLQTRVPMAIQKKVRDVMFDFAKDKAYKVLREVAEEYPQFFTGAFDPSLGPVKYTKQGSNQYQARGKVTFEISNELFDAIESGAEFTPFSGTFIQKIKPHKRELGKPKGRIKKAISKIQRSKPKMVRVQKHTRTYTNMKPVQLSTGEWRMLKGTPAVKAKKVVEKKVNKVMKNEREIGAYIKQFLS